MNFNLLILSYTMEITSLYKDILVIIYYTLSLLYSYDPQLEALNTLQQINVYELYFGNISMMEGEL